MQRNQLQQQAHPLSPENINTISAVCGKFISERYNVELAGNTLRQILTNIHKKNLEYYRTNPPLPSLEELNKRAISEVRDFILQQQQRSPQIQQSPPPQQQPPRSNSQLPPPPQRPPQQLQELQHLQEQQFQQRQHFETNIQQFQPLPPPQIQQSIPQQQTQTPPQQQQSQLQPQSQGFEQDFAEISERNDNLISESSDISIREEKNEDDFFKKLQTLELQRGTQINLQQPANDPLPSSASQQRVQPAPPQSTNTIIYMSNSTTADARHTKPIVLCGASRMWVHIVDRNIISFNGPLPDTMNIHLSRLMLPKRVSQNTPCINVRIKSATDKNMEVLCHLDKEGPIWDIWKPISSALSLIKTFACPWTITLYDLFNKPLEMGKDGNIISSVTRLMNGNTKITIDPETDAKSYAQLLLQTQDGIEEHINSLHIMGNTIEIPGDYTHIKVNESYICNLQAQAYIVLEMEKDTITESE
jgi:hypothetical protein